MTGYFIQTKSVGQKLFSINYTFRKGKKQSGQVFEAKTDRGGREWLISAIAKVLPDKFYRVGIENTTCCHLFCFNNLVGRAKYQPA